MGYGRPLASGPTANRPDHRLATPRVTPHQHAIANARMGRYIPSDITNGIAAGSVSF
jgi:hypothetical protein